MALELEYLNKCTLLQASEWIAFKWKPMLPIYERAIGRIRPRSEAVYNKLDKSFEEQNENYSPYRNAIEKAGHILEAHIFQKKISISGLLNIELLKNMENDILEEFKDGRRSKEKEEDTTNLEAIQKGIKSFSKYKGKRLPIIYTLDDEICIDDEMIIINDPDKGQAIYKDIEIEFTDLEREFPEILDVTPINSEIRTYTTPYIDIMFEVIDEQKITNDNQGKKDHLGEIIAEKIKLRGLRESRHIANAMATMIRLSESQNGRGVKKKE